MPQAFGVVELALAVAAPEGGAAEEEVGARGDVDPGFWLGRERRCGGGEGGEGGAGTAEAGEDAEVGVVPFPGVDLAAVLAGEGHPVAVCFLGVCAARPLEDPAAAADEGVGRAEELDADVEVVVLCRATGGRG